MWWGQQRKWLRRALHELLRQLLPAGEEAVPRELTGCILSLARFCAQPSELAVAERWSADSALADLLAGTGSPDQ